MLHHVGDDATFRSLEPYAVRKDRYLSLLQYIEEQEYETATFQRLQDHAAKPQIIISFDDCGKHLFDFAIPELLKRNMKACFYIPTAHIGCTNSWDAAAGRSAVELMNRDEIHTLAGLGMEVGSHSHRHIRLDEIDEAVFREEAATSKNILEAITGNSVVSFSYPFGAVPATAANNLRGLGYQYALGIYTPFQRRFSLRRFIYHNGDTHKTLRQKLSRTYAWYRKLSDWRRSS